VHREVNYEADSLATSGQDTETVDEVMEATPLPDGMPLRRPPMHLLNCTTPCTNVHVRLETWTV
jgi:hypothetical protein